MPHGLEPCAQRCRWTFPAAVPAADCASALAAFLAGLAARCQAPGGHVIGHIKAFAPLPSGGYLRGNAVSARLPPDVELHDPAGVRVAELDVTVNVLVMGLAEASCRLLLAQALDAIAASRGFACLPLAPRGQGDHP